MLCTNIFYRAKRMTFKCYNLDSLLITIRISLIPSQLLICIFDNGIFSMTLTLTRSRGHTHASFRMTLAPFFTQIIDLRFAFNLSVSFQLCIGFQCSMALRIPKIVGKSSQICLQSGRVKLLSIGDLNLRARPIMTALARMEKALEQLKSNPYYEKYAKDIARLQETSPEEFLSRIKEREAKMAQQKGMKNYLKSSARTIIFIFVSIGHHECGRSSHFS